MTHSPRTPLLGAILAGALLASCQAAQPSAPGVDVATAAAPQPDMGTVAGRRKMLGFSPLLGEPGRALGIGAPAFTLQASEYLWGVETTINTNTGDQDFPDLAYNSIEKNYYAVWQDARNGADNLDVYGVTLASNVIPGTAAAVASTAASLQLAPRVAYNSTSASNEYLVAWTDYRNGHADVYTQRVTKAGAVVGSPLQVTSVTGNQVLVGLAYSPTATASAGQYLVVWADDATGSGMLKGRRLSVANALVGTADIAISATAGALGNGGVAVNGSGDYVVTWANGTTPGVYAQRVKASDGTVLGSTLTVDAGSSYEFYAPRIAFASTTAGCLVTYERRTAASGEADAYLRRLTMDATTFALNGAAAAVTTATGAQVGPVVAGTSAGNFLVTWADGRDGGDDLDVYSKVYNNGAVTIPEFMSTSYADTSPVSLQAMPAVAYDSVRDRFIAIFQDSRLYTTSSGGWNLYGQRLLSAAMVAEDLMEDALTEATELGAGGSAISHITNAIKFLTEQNRPDKAIDFLNSFISKVNTDGGLTAEEKAALVAIAQEAIDQINDGNCETTACD